MPTWSGSRIFSHMDLRGCAPATGLVFATSVLGVLARGTAAIQRFQKESAEKKRMVCCRKPEEVHLWACIHPALHLFRQEDVLLDAGAQHGQGQELFVGCVTGDGTCPCGNALKKWTWTGQG